MMPDAETLYDVVEGTWPPARKIPSGPFVLRDGRGGGKRVSAATIIHPNWSNDDIEAAAQGMQTLNQQPLFMLRDGEDRLDNALESLGYRVVDPVNMYCVPVGALAHNIPPRLSTFDVWPPLAIGHELWREGGINPARWAVMDRVNGPKTSILGRSSDRAAGIAFVAIREGVAMLHALEVALSFRRKGVAENMMAAAAVWAQHHGATHFSVICTAANEAANSLYMKIGMTKIGGYHYRIK